MYNRIKDFLLYCINVLVAVLLLLAFASYVMISSVIMTRVVNDLRLDTFIIWDTGLGIVMLILLLGWAPVWVMRSFRPSSRYVGKL